ncbi:MAG: tRNA (adenosine(37)-N6)-dimethylallyltransferase MiaA [Myxococcota bacterium]|nr:tRNA (adenosine(37)-N6)-dimethylallyltransferase MiaA [Myxococcota bacterium]
MSAPLVAIVGPTGSGKSGLADRLAESLSGEIISCDSIQIYRGFDIGSAKPTLDDQSRASYHLIDVADWDEPFDAQMYRTKASAALADIRLRHRTPILCGGTGLYLRGFRWGLIDVPPSSPEIREELEALEQKEAGSVFAMLRELDPETALRISRGNIRYAIRAIEIFRQTGEKASALKREHAFQNEEVPMRVYWLNLPSETLRARIERRVGVMMASGLVDEVDSLLRAGVDEDSTPMRSVGYREIVRYLRREMTLDEATAAIISATWKYARRQRTWLRREREVIRLDIAHPDEALEMISVQT